MMVCETALQIPIVLPSLRFRGNSLLPSGRPSSLSSSHFSLMGLSSVLLLSHFLFLSVLFCFLFSQTSFLYSFLCSIVILSPVLSFLTAAFSCTLPHTLICSSPSSFSYPPVVIFISCSAFLCRFGLLTLQLFISIQAFCIMYPRIYLNPYMYMTYFHPHVCRHTHTYIHRGV